MSYGPLTNDFLRRLDENLNGGVLAALIILVPLLGFGELAPWLLSQPSDILVMAGALVFFATAFCTIILVTMGITRVFGVKKQ